MRLPPVMSAALSVRSTGREGPEGQDRQNGRFPALPAYPAPPAQSQYENVPKKADRLFGSLHFVPSAAPVKRFCAVTPIAASSIVENGWNHCIAPQVGS